MKISNTPRVAESSMTSSERPSLEPILEREASPAVLAGENSGDALEALYALICGAGGVPAALSRRIPGYALRASPGSFRSFLGVSPGMSQPYWGCGPETARYEWATYGKCTRGGSDKQ